MYKLHVQGVRSWAFAVGDIGAGDIAGDIAAGNIAVEILQRELFAAGNVRYPMEFTTATTVTGYGVHTLGSRTLCSYSTNG